MPFSLNQERISPPIGAPPKQNVHLPVLPSMKENSIKK